MSVPIHFYLTFNPYLNSFDGGHTQAHEFYNLLEKRLKDDPTDGHAYWGKMIAKDRDSRIDEAQLNALIASNKAMGCSTHIYITDYTYLWVGKVTEVLTDRSSSNLICLEFYKEKKVEAWFKITDFTILTYTPEDTACKLQELYIDNAHHELKIDGLSPFTTGIRLPAFVQDLSEEAYFDEIEDDIPSGKLLFKYHPALSNSNSKKVLESLHHYAFPEAMYSRIPHAAKTELESAELDIVEKRYHNISRNAFGYVKALEIVLNDLTIHHLKRKGFGGEFFVKPDSMPPKLYLSDEMSGLVPINKWHKNYSITQLIYFVERCVEQNNFCFKKAYQNHRQFIQFLTRDMVQVLKESKMLEIRGILAHNDSNAISEQDAHVMRNLIVGIGTHGLIAKAYQSFYFEEFKSLTQVSGDYKKVDFKELLKKTA